MSPNSNHLLPPNSTALEKALSLTMARIEDVPVPVDLLFNPDLCPASHLPWLAWALSVDNWNANWPESVKRQVIKNSIEVHRHKGTRGALNAALAALECAAETQEWWEKTPHGEPHTFSVTAWAAKLGTLDKERQKDILIAINAVKPVRSHFDFSIGTKLGKTLRMVAGGEIRQVRRISAAPRFAPKEVSCKAQIAAAGRVMSIVRISASI